MTILRTALAGVAAGAVAAACSGRDVFACTDPSQCDDGTTAGVCEASGYCSFPDEACMSGRRYGERAPAELAGECVVPLDETTGGVADEGGDPTTITTTITTTTTSTTTATTTSTTTSTTTTPVNPDTSTGGPGETSLATSEESSTTQPADPLCETVLVEEFDGDAIDPLWTAWIDPGCSIGVADGRLQMEIAPSDVDWLSTGVWEGPFVLAGGHARVQVVPFEPPLDVVGVWLSTNDADDCQLQVAAAGGTVLAKVLTPDIDEPLGSVPLALDQPVWLQIRIDADDFVWWEYSLDGDDWLVIHAEADPCNVGAEAYVGLFAGDQFVATETITRAAERIEICTPI